MDAVIPAGVAALAPVPKPNEASAALAKVVPSPLRVDLIIRRQFFKNEEYYVIKDPLALTYFRLQSEEAYVATLLDGKRTLAEVVERVNARYPNSPRTLEEMGRFINQLAMTGLLNINARRFVENARRPMTRNLILAWGRMIQKMLFFKIPLVDPSPWLGGLSHALRFVWSKWFVGACLVLFAWTIGLLVVNHHAFAAHELNFFSSSNLFLFWLTLIGIKTLHEFGHATTCRHFGGEVHEMGVCFMCFTPCGYVDASDAWMMRHKRHKLFVTIAGVFTEFIIACIAAHLWLVLPDGIGRDLAFNAMLVASINTVIFNANPLMKFDGYYVVSDILEIPNLRSKSIAYCSYHLQRIFLGYRNVAQESSFEQEANGRVFVIYAVLAYVYMMMIIYGLTQIFARVLTPIGLHDFGLALGYFVEGSFVAFPFVKVIMDATKPGAHIVKTGSTRRRVGTTLGVIAALVAGSFFIPTHYQVEQQAVMLAESGELVAAEVGGVVDEVHVKTGQWVEPGDLLATLNNPEVESDLLVQEAALREARLRFSATPYQRGWTSTTSQAGAANQMEVAEAAYARAHSRASLLQIKAKVAGYVLTPGVERLAGTYASPQQPIMRIADTRQLRLVVPLTEDQAQLVQSGSEVTGRWQATARSFTTHLDAIASQPARRADFHLGMLTTFGGPAPTQMVSAGGSERLHYAVYLATAPLPQPDHSVVEGLRVQVKIEGLRTTYAKRIWRWFLSLWSVKTIDPI